MEGGLYELAIDGCFPICERQSVARACARRVTSSLGLV